MNTRTTVIFLIIAIAAGVIAILKFRSPPGGTNSNEVAARRLFDAETFNVDEVTRISLAYPGKTPYVFERSDETWSQTEPGFFALDSWSVRALATSASDLMISEVIPVAEMKDDLAPERLGLSPPAATVSYEMESGDTFSVHLGRLFAGGRAYVRLDENGDAYVVNDALHQRALEGDPTEWRNKSIFNELGTEVSRIEFLNHLENTSIRLARIGGQWRLTSPVNTHVDTNAVQSLISELGRARLRGFVDDTPPDLSIYGLDEPAVRIVTETDRIEGEGQVNTDRQVLLLGHTIDLQDETRYAKREGRTDVFTVASSTWNGLTPDPVDLVSRYAVNLEAPDIRSFRVESAGTTFVLRRSMDAWDFLPAEGDAMPADSGAVEVLLARVTSPLEGVELGAIDPLKLDGPLHRLTVFGFDDQPAATISIGTEVSEDGSHRLVFDDGSGAIRYSGDAEILSLDPDLYQGTGERGGPAEEPTK